MPSDFVGDFGTLAPQQFQKPIRCLADLGKSQEVHPLRRAVSAALKPQPPFHRDKSPHVDSGDR